MVKRWRFLINDYLRGRQVLKRTLVLVDARHGLKDVDREVMTMLDQAAVSYNVVLTKADKIKASALAGDARRGHARSRQASRLASRPVHHVERNRHGHRRVEDCNPGGGDPVKLIIGNRAYSSWSFRGWLACKQSGERVRGTRRADVRRGLGKAPRRRRIRPLARQGARAVGRRLRRVGQPRDHRIPRRPRRPRHDSGPPTPPRAAWRARWPPKCIRASPICAATCR